MWNNFEKIAKEFDLLNLLLKKTDEMMNKVVNKDKLIPYLFNFLINEYGDLTTLYDDDETFCNRFVNKFLFELTQNLGGRIDLVGKQQGLKDDELEVIGRTIGSFTNGNNTEIKSIEEVIQKIQQQNFNIQKQGKYVAYFTAISMLLRENIEEFVRAFQPLFSIGGNDSYSDDDDDEYEEVDLSSYVTIAEFNTEINRLDNRIDNLPAGGGEENLDITEEIKRQIKNHNDDINDHDLTRHPNIQYRINSYVQDIENVKGRLNALEEKLNNGESGSGENTDLSAEIKKHIDDHNIDINAHFLQTELLTKRLDDLKDKIDNIVISEGGMVETWEYDLDGGYSAIIIKTSTMTYAFLRQRDGTNKLLPTGTIPREFRPISPITSIRTKTTNGYLQIYNSGQLVFNSAANETNWYQLTYPNDMSINNDNATFLSMYRKDMLDYIIEKELKKQSHVLNDDDFKYLKIIDKKY